MILIVTLVVGVLVGIVLAGAVMVWMMRSSMIVPQRSASSFEETCAAIERAVPAGDGWSFPMPSLDMWQKLADKDQAPDGMRKIRLFFVCKPSLAKRVLSDTPKMAAIMPCAWAIYELEDSSVWLAKMNISMMSRMFSGEVATAMGEVAAADERFMAEILS